MAEQSITPCWLSTIDNPFNPYTDLVQWLYFDSAAGYCSCEMVDDWSNTNDTMSPVEYAAEIERAIDDIIANDPTGLRIKVFPSKTTAATAKTA